MILKTTAENTNRQQGSAFKTVVKPKEPITQQPNAEGLGGDSAQAELPRTRSLFDQPVQDNVAAAVNAAIAENPKHSESSALHDQLIKTLLTAPKEIYHAQIEYDALDIEYRRVTTNASVSALSAQIFPDKTGEFLRAASNDKEREIAITKALTGTQELYELALERDSTYAVLQRLKSEFEAAKLLVQSGITLHNVYKATGE